MQSIAAEFNLSETVFILPDKDGDNRYRIRWFTPTNEVALCGHATLATGHVLFNEPNLFSGNIDTNKPLVYKTNFDTVVGTDKNGEHIVLDFPINRCEPIQRQHFQWIEKVVQGIFDGNKDKELVQDILYAPTMRKMIVRLKDSATKEDLTSIKPNFDQLAKVDVANQLLGVIVTRKSCFDSEKVHFMSRNFVPWLGINEDPVTGSAHTILAPYWQQVYREECGKDIDTLVALQASKRSGILWCTLQTDRVLIKGVCKTFASGTIK